MTAFAAWLDAQRLRPAAPTRWWIATLLFGATVLLFGSLLGGVFPQSGYAMKAGYGAPVLAFEFARGQADLVAIFGPDSDPLQVTRLAAMRSGNEQDYIYMLLYAGFLTSGVLALWRETRLRPLFVAAALPVLAALCDAYENWLLLDIQAAYTVGDYSPMMASLPYPVAAKFLLLALTNVAIGVGLAQIGRWWALAGTLVIVACIPTLMAVVAPEDFGWTLLAATGGGWVALLGAAAIGGWHALVRKRPLVDFGMEAPRPQPVAAQATPTRKLFGRRS